jgi:hypothetical protein
MPTSDQNPSPTNAKLPNPIPTSPQLAALLSSQLQVGVYLYQPITIPRTFLPSLTDANLHAASTNFLIAWQQLCAQQNSNTTKTSS